MTDVFVGGRSSDAAILLLAAAEDLGLEPGVVRTTGKGYLVPEGVAKAANLGPSEEAPAPAQPAKKAAPRRGSSKKSKE